MIFFLACYVSDTSLGPGDSVNKTDKILTLMEFTLGMKGVTGWRERHNKMCGAGSCYAILKRMVSKDISEGVKSDHLDHWPI